MAYIKNLFVILSLKVCNTRSATINQESCEHMSYWILSESLTSKTSSINSKKGQMQACTEFSL